MTLGMTEFISNVWEKFMNEQQRQINFGTWAGKAKSHLFTHTEHDGRTAFTLHADALQYDHQGNVCAKKTAKHVRGIIQKQFGDKVDPNSIRWHKSTEVKQLLGDKSGMLVTFIHEHLTIQ